MFCRHCSRCSWLALARTRLRTYLPRSSQGQTPIPPAERFVLRHNFSAFEIHDIGGLATGNRLLPALLWSRPSRGTFMIVMRKWTASSRSGRNDCAQNIEFWCLTNATTRQQNAAPIALARQRVDFGEVRYRSCRLRTLNHGRLWVTTIQEH